MLSPQTKILLIGSDLWYLGEGMFGPLLAVFAGKVGGNILDITLAWAIYLATKGILIILIGRFSDTSSKFTKERLMLLGYALNALFTFGFLLVNSTLSLFIVEMGIGFATALSIPTWTALYSKYDTGKNSGTIWGLVSGLDNMLTAIAIIAGGLIVSHYSFTTLFIIMGIIQIIATIYQAKILRYQ